MIEAVMTAKETGDSHVLSENDISIIALALELKKEDVDQIAVISSDFAVQNVCKKLNIRYESFKNGTIKKQIMWSYMCLSCRAIFKQMPPDEECETCGGEVVRKSGTKKKKKN
jgi:rRNA maturation endonuclease Nob1